MDPDGVLVGPLPERTAGTRLFAVEDADGLWSVQAFAPEVQVAIPRLYSATQTPRLALLDYEDTLLHPLAEGFVRPATGTECGRFALPTPDVVRTLRLSADSTWQRLDRVPASLGDYRYLGDCPCASFEAMTLELQTRTPTLARTLVADTGQSIVAVIPPDRTGYIVNRAGLSATTISPDTIDFPITSVAGDGRGGLLIAGARGRIVRWRPGGAFESLDIHGADVVRAVHARAEAMYAVRSDGLYRRSDGPWSMVVEPFGTGDGEIRGLIATDDAGRVAATIAESDAFVLIEPDRPAVMDSARILNSPINSLSWTQAYGLVAHTAARRVFRWLDGQWVQISIPAPSIQIIFPWRGGFLHAGNAGSFGEVLPGADVCPLSGAVAQMSWRHGAVRENLVVLSGILEEGQSPPAQLLLLEAPPQQ